MIARMFGSFTGKFNWVWWPWQNCDKTASESESRQNSSFLLRLELTNWCGTLNYSLLCWSCVNASSCLWLGESGSRKASGRPYLTALWFRSRYYMSRHMRPISIVVMGDLTFQLPFNFISIADRCHADYPKTLYTRALLRFWNIHDQKEWYIHMIPGSCRDRHDTNIWQLFPCTLRFLRRLYTFQTTRRKENNNLDPGPINKRAWG